MWAMPNLMVALPNIGGALCSTPQSLADAVRWCRDGDFLRPVFAASRVQRISDLHSKFALRPHHVPKYGKHPITDR